MIDDKYDDIEESKSSLDDNDMLHLFKPVCDNPDLDIVE